MHSANRVTVAKLQAKEIRIKLCTALATAHAFIFANTFFFKVMSEREIHEVLSGRQAILGLYTVCMDTYTYIHKQPGLLRNDYHPKRSVLHIWF